MAEQYIYLNGEFVTKEKATISVYDHGFFCTVTAFLRAFAFITGTYLNARSIWTGCMIQRNPLCWTFR